jgi:hypothetical protein
VLGESIRDKIDRLKCGRWRLLNTGGIP